MKLQFETFSNPNVHIFDFQEARYYSVGPIKEIHSFNHLVISRESFIKNGPQKRLQFYTFDNDVSPYSEIAKQQNDVEVYDFLMGNNDADIFYDQRSRSNLVDMIEKHKTLTTGYGLQHTDENGRIVYETGLIVLSASPSDGLRESRKGVKSILSFKTT